MDTPIQFADGKELIVHHTKRFEVAELLALKSLTSIEFKQRIKATGKFIAVPINGNPFLARRTQ